MPTKKRCLMIGGGGMAGNWIRRFFPNFADRVETALVDVAPAILASAGDFLGLPADRRYTSVEQAFAEVDADFCAIVIPPAFHRDVVLGAVRRGMPILSEKPIADDWEACAEIYRAVTGAGLKMQVIQNYRYDVSMLTMRQVLRSGSLGRINYVVARFAADYRQYASWGAVFRHEIPHALLVEGAVHHFDMLRNLTGRDHIVRIHRFKRGGGLVVEEVPPVTMPYDGHNYLIDEFLTWLDGGPTPATALAGNIKSVAMVFGAIEASRTGQVVDVAAMLRELG